MTKRIVIALTFAVLAGCGGSSAPSDGAVASALKTLLSDNGITAGAPACIHQGGNEYTCQVLTYPSGFTTYQVTDDGHGISADGPGEQTQTTATATPSDIGQPAEGSACTQADGSKGVIVIEGPTAANPGEAECVP